MQNPSHVMYAPEELFSLKVSPFILQEVSPVSVVDDLPAAVDDVSTAVEPKTGFWKKYQWHVVGFVAVAGIIFFIYKKQQKKKKERSQ